MNKLEEVVSSISSTSLANVSRDEQFRQIAGTKEGAIQSKFNNCVSSISLSFEVVLEVIEEDSNFGAGLV